ncbi:PAS domain-containing sensor histidine kinase [Aggregatilineales bacterium SYSU G02658]
MIMTGNEALYRVLFDSNRSVAMLLNPRTGEIVDANAAACAYYGYHLEQMRAMDVSQLSSQPPEVMRSAMVAALQQTSSGGVFKHRLADNSLRDVEIEFVPVEWDGRRLLYTTVTDVTVTMQIETSLRGGESRFNRLIDIVPQGICVQSPNDQFVFVNDKFCELVGYSREELLANNILLILHPSSRGMMRHQGQLRRTGESSIYETKLMRRDGSEWYALVSAAPVQDREGRFQGTFSIFTDITARKEAEEALRESNAELDAFAHTVAHDLKNPLSVLVGFSNLLESDYEGMEVEQVKESLQIIGHTATKMVSIIDELMLLAQMRRSEIKLEPIDTPRLLREAFTRLRFMINQYSAVVEIANEHEIPVALGYAPWVEQVWINYLSNAMKYGGTPPHVVVGGEMTGDGRVRFFVRDNGRGLSRDKLDRLFIPFERLEKSRAEGHGLGLSIVKRILDKLGGEVDVVSEVGVGSEFRFILPCALPPQ